MTQPISLSRLTREIVRCWLAAEGGLRNDILTKHWNPAEEDITFALCGHLREAVADANEHGRFAQAFAADLGRAFPDLAIDSWSISAGLTGSVSFHGRQYEGRVSAADIGLLLARPSVTQSPWSQDSISISADTKRALLAQAKLGKVERERSSWGKLTERQRVLFSKHSGYLALLLYTIGGSKTENLAPFMWQLCEGATVDEIESWLGQDHFPSKRDSADVIEALATGRIGSDDPSVCDMVIDPNNAETRCIEIRVSWPDGIPPNRGTVRRHIHSPVQNVVRQHSQPRGTL